MADLIIENISHDYKFTNRDGYNANSGKKGIGITFHNGKRISFKEGVTEELALEILKSINDIEG